jgi:hypothetical protein
MSPDEATAGICVNFVRTNSPSSVLHPFHLREVESDDCIHVRFICTSYRLHLLSDRDTFLADNGDQTIVLFDISFVHIGTLAFLFATPLGSNTSRTSSSDWSFWEGC